MDHSSAINNHTAERYLLGELTTVERDAYEEHFFSCPDCAEEIMSASDFIETARQVVQKELRVESYSRATQSFSWGRWLNWRSVLRPLPAFVCALLVMLGGLVGYQNFVTMPQLTQMASAHVVLQDKDLAERLRNNNMEELVLEDVHGVADSASASKPVLLRFGIPQPVPGVSFDSYQAEIMTSSNTVKYSFGISRQQAQDPVLLELQAGVWRPGKYFLVIRGVKSSAAAVEVKGELARRAFELN